MKKEKVLLGMSGGVDSSVAAMLLQKQGYEVIGAFMKNWSDTKNKLTGECQWKEERRVAQKIADRLGIKLITLDFENQYKKLVVDEMFKKYKKGITPNPDIDCNKEIKFPLLIKEAKKLGINLIATGHYVRNKKTRNKYQLVRAKDEMKDQSYFLYTIRQNELKHCLFPIGELTKQQVREIAEKNNFPNYAKKSTVGICFIGKINLKQFLQQRIKPKKGKIMNPEGKQIGEHDGIYYYTIGQRIGPRFGIEISYTLANQDGKDHTKWYVAKKDAKTNTIIAAPEVHPLNFRKEIIIQDFYLIDEKKENYKNESHKVLARIRQVGELLPSKLFFEKGKFKLTLDKAITGVADGQAVVLYKGEKVLGGGTIFACE
ncbi:tRNA 2-thiouridine(34) synthase MnmA [Candidatus Pacearchaeota archaeon]|nr:tRNA 2-thiouridine(34) synthase MnmA [Candidatus Pacearchaeota archaeon]